MRRFAQLAGLAAVCAAGQALAQGYVNNGAGSSIVGGRDNTSQAHTLNTDSQGNLQVTAPTGNPLPVTLSGPGGVTTVVGVGVAGVPDGGVLTIQGIDGGYPLNVAGTFQFLFDGGVMFVQGLGTPGTPVGQVVSIQGVSGGQTVPVSGTVSISSGTATVPVALVGDGGTLLVTLLNPSLPVTIYGDGGTLPVSVVNGSLTPTGVQLVDPSAQDAGATNNVFCGHVGTLITTALSSGTARSVEIFNGGSNKVCIGTTPALSCPEAIDAGTTVGEDLPTHSYMDKGTGVPLYCVAIPGQEQVSPDAGLVVVPLR